MDPYHVLLVGHFQGGLAVEAVHPLIGLPHAVVEDGVLEEVVEEGPQGLVAEAVVEVLDLSLAEEHGATVHLLQVGDHLLFMTPEFFAGQTRPAQPYSLFIPIKGAQTCGQSPGTGLIVEFSLPLAHRDGETIGNDDQPLFHGCPPHLR